MQLTTAHLVSELRAEAVSLENEHNVVVTSSTLRSLADRFAEAASDERETELVLRMARARAAQLDIPWDMIHSKGMERLVIEARAWLAISREAGA